MAGIQRDSAGREVYTFDLPTNVSGSQLGQLIYSSNGSVTVGVSSTARASMMPPAQAGTSVTVKAGTMPVGAMLMLTGYGTISANATTPGNFTFTPHVTPSGGSKTDLPGLVATPLIGVAGICEIALTYLQTSTGILTGGRIRYGLDNSTAQYTLTINPSDSVVASSPDVDRQFGADGQWQSSYAANFVTSKLVMMTLMRAPTA